MVKKRSPDQTSFRVFGLPPAVCITTLNLYFIYGGTNKCMYGGRVIVGRPSSVRISTLHFWLEVFGTYTYWLGWYTHVWRASCGRPTINRPYSDRHYKWRFIHRYIYVCVCVCVCVTLTRGRPLLYCRKQHKIVACCVDICLPSNHNGHAQSAIHGHDGPGRVRCIYRYDG